MNPALHATVASASSDSAAKSYSNPIDIQGFSGAMQNNTGPIVDGSLPRIPAQAPLVSTRSEGDASDHPFGEDLANQHRPTDNTTRTLLGPVEKLDVLALTTEPPVGRIVRGDSIADQMFRLEVRGLIESDIIGPQSLVISSTGHDIPIMAALFERLNMSGVLHIPDYPEGPGNQRRVANQAATYGADIERFEARNAANGSVDSFFIGVDGHRPRGSFDISLLPTAEQLEAAGVNRIVFLGEIAIGPVDFGQTGEFEPYLKRLEAAGIEVIMRGIDPRQPRR